MLTVFAALTASIVLGHPAAAAVGPLEVDSGRHVVVLE
jgi:hypothetical protein